MHHPEFFFSKGFENALVNPGNPYILRNHLLCAAWELPLTDADAVYFGEAYAAERDELVTQGQLKERRGRYYLSPRIAYPAQGTGIRSASNESFKLINTATDTLLETIESSIALFQIYPGAVYLHQGESYLVAELDFASKIAYAAPTEVSYYTQAKDLTDLRISKILKRASYARCRGLPRRGGGDDNSGRLPQEIAVYR